MSARLDLSPDEEQELARLLAELTTSLGREQSLGAMLRGWDELVGRIERGYGDSIYEYTDDLSVRDRLERVVEGAGSALRAKLQARLDESDRRFEAATEESARPLAKSRDPRAPWWDRVPVRRIGELAGDLESLGYVRR